MARTFRDSTARSSVVIAIVMHAIAFVVFFVWAAKTGKIEQVMRVIGVVPVQKEKPKEPKEEPKPKTEEAKLPEQPKPAAETPKNVAETSPAAANTAPPAMVAAPPPTAPADFFFSDGAKPVETVTNAVVVSYKNWLEYSIRCNWTKPPEAPDEEFVAEAEVTVDPSGNLVKYDWLKGSGNQAWDDSVRKALAATKGIKRSRPAGFPAKFVVRFDTVTTTEEIPLVQ